MLLHVVLPVIAGAAIYVLWRSPTLQVFHWLEAAGVGSVVRALRAAAAPARSLLPPWVLLSLPDGLWVYALTAWLAQIWRGAKGRARVAWLSVGPCLGVGSELGQWAGLVPGTFDVADLIAGAAAAALSLALNARRGEPSCGVVISNR